MAAVTRLGLYGGSRGLYGDFAAKVSAVTRLLNPLIVSMGRMMNR